MKLVLITLIMISFANADVAARLWSSIAVEDTVFLAQDLEIHNTDLLLPRTSRMRVTEVSSMDMINVYLYKVKAESCSHPSATSELELYTVQQRRGQTTIGIELLKNCRLEIYVEKKDHKTRSLFN